MPAGGRITILLITSERLVRADVRPGRASECRVYQQPRPPSDDLPSLVEAALHLGPKRVGRVLVLSSDFWTQTLALGSAVAAGMSNVELVQALAFEAEPFSGISALDSRLCPVPTQDEGDQQRFWITQIPAALEEDIRYVVRQSGGRLLGVAHPAGLGLPLAQAHAAASAWRRVELWPESIVCLHSQPASAVAMHVNNSSPQAKTWAQEAESWLGGFVAPKSTEVLIGTSAFPPSEVHSQAASVDGEVFDLAEDDVLRNWLAAWAAEVTGRTPRVPLIRPVAKPIPDSTRLLIGCAIGAVALATCVGHHFWVSSAKQQIAEQLAVLEEPAERLAEIEKQAKEVQEQLASLEGEATALQDDLTRCRQALGAQRHRVARLLASLTRNDPNDYVLQAIESDRDGLRVHGICTNPEHANRLAMALDRQLRPLGLRVHLPEKEAQYVATGQGAYRFELLIQDLAGLESISPTSEARLSIAAQDRSSHPNSKSAASPAASPPVDTPPPTPQRGESPGDGTREPSNRPQFGSSPQA